MNHRITIDGQDCPVLIRRHKNSRHMTVRYLPATHAVALTIPRYVSIRQGLSFVEEKRGWIGERIRECPARVAFADGAVIPLFGAAHVVRHRPGRGLVTSAPGEIAVPGDAAFLGRRLTDWLKAQLLGELRRLCESKAAMLGRAPKKIELRDMRSRWGSCGSDGRLCFSWRLVFAPPGVLDYMASHEMAHLAHMDHSPHFWRQVEALCPEYREAREWLKRHGQLLHAFY